MKLKNLIIGTAIALGLSLSLGLRAEVLQNLNVSITTFSQRSVLDNGTNTFAAAPKIQSHNTAEILKILAQDKAAQGNWPSNNFPTGAKLAAGDDRFVVVLGTNVLIDVSDILRSTNGINRIVSGKKNDLTGLANPATVRLQIGRLDFDDTAIAGGTGLKFYIQGLLTEAQTDTAPVAGVYTRTQTAKLSNGTGEGTTSGGDTFVLTGTITAFGRAKQTLP
jgi:hypothetical protein